MCRGTNPRRHGHDNADDDGIIRYARSGNADAATADIAKLAELRDKLQQDKDAYWAEIVDIQRQVATAWQLNAQGQPFEPPGIARHSASHPPAAMGSAAAARRPAARPTLIWRPEAMPNTPSKHDGSSTGVHARSADLSAEVAEEQP